MRRRRRITPRLPRNQRNVEGGVIFEKDLPLVAAELEYLSGFGFAVYDNTVLVHWGLDPPRPGDHGKVFKGSVFVEMYTGFFDYLWTKIACTDKTEIWEQILSRVPAKAVQRHQRIFGRPLPPKRQAKITMDGYTRMKRLLFLQDIAIEHQSLRQLISEAGLPFEPLWEDSRGVEARDAVDAVVTVNSKVDEAVLERYANLRMVAVAFTGYDCVDLEACERRGIKDYNRPIR